MDRLLTMGTGGTKDIRSRADDDVIGLQDAQPYAARRTRCRSTAALKVVLLWSASRG